MQPLLAGHEALLRPFTTKRLCKLLAAPWLPGMQRSRDRKESLQIDADVDSRAKSTKRHMGGDHVGGLDEVISEIS